MNALDKAISQMDAAKRAAFLEHLDGGTSADYLADWLKRNGTPVSATTIKVLRRTREGRVE